MRRINKVDITIISAIVLAYLIANYFVSNSYYQLILVLIPVWAMVGIAWNLLSGFSGLISFGHAAFFGLGAYTVALLLEKFGITPWFGIPVATMVGALAGLLIGLPTFRLRGHYFALAMLAYPVGLLYLFEWLGFQEVSIPMMRDNPAAYMQFADYRIYGLMAIAALALCLLLSLWIEKGRFGLSLMAIKQNEIAAQAAGIHVRRWKMAAIALSGAITGMIGGFYAIIMLIVTPHSVFGVLVSAQALIVTLFGGIGTTWGPLIGAAILIPLGETLHAEFGSQLPGISGVVYGVAIIVIILAAPEGIFWKLRDFFVSKPVAAAAEPVVAEARELWSRAPASLAGRDIILEVRGLSKSYGGLKAVQNVSFDVPKGAIVGIIGPNGAGKTTLFNLLNGIAKADSGTVKLAGRDLTGLSPSEICNAGIGRTFQVVRAFPRLSVLQNVIVGAYSATNSDAEAERLAREALDIVGLAGSSDLIAGGLNSKQLRLMELARALAGRPQILLLDETLAGLGAEEVEDILSVLGDISHRGVTIVVIEHTMGAMLRLADNFIVLDHGVVLTQGVPDQVVKERAVIEAYLGKKWIAENA